MLRRRYEYYVARRHGDHWQLRSHIRGGQHTVTVPQHRHLRVGTLNIILDRVARYLGMTRDEVLIDLFGD